MHGLGLLTHFGTPPSFSDDLAWPLYVIIFAVAGRFGSPMTSTVCVGGPYQVSAGCPAVKLDRTTLTENGLVRRISNSPEGGGAIERGIVVDLLVVEGVLTVDCCD